MIHKIGVSSTMPFFRLLFNPQLIVRAFEFQTLHQRTVLYKCPSIYKRVQKYNKSNTKPNQNKKALESVFERARNRKDYKGIIIYTKQLFNFRDKRHIIGLNGSSSLYQILNALRLAIDKTSSWQEFLCYPIEQYGCACWRALPRLRLLLFSDKKQRR